MADVGELDERDVRVLLGHLDALAMLARWRQTPVKAIRAALHQVRSVGGTVVGVAMTMVDLKNQARVHVWYEQRFGRPCSRLASAQDGISRFPVAGTCIGLSPQSDGTAILYAPFGLEDIFTGILRPSPLNDALTAFRPKASSYNARWPHLTIDEHAAANLDRNRQIGVRA